MKNLRFLFENHENIQTNFSQAGQDLFVLSALNGKKNGKFLDLGCHHPTQGGNNTYLLEKDFNWNGLSYDINPTPIKEFPKYRASKAMCQDCLNINWEEVISFSSHFDYLSLDLEPAAITFECLKRIPLDKVEFSVITYEHDMYRFGEEYKHASHKLLSSYGYIRVCENIKHNGNIFEDWYINPKYVEITPQLENLKYHSNKEYSDIIFLNSDYNYTIVTGLIDDVNDYRSSDIYLNLSKELLSLDIPKIIFISEKHFDFVKKYSDSRLTQIVKFEKEDMYQFYAQFNENQNYNLPKNINFKKDTLDYFKCINLKSFWLKEALNINKFNNHNQDYFAWIDFGIKHLIKDNLLHSYFQKKFLGDSNKIRMASMYEIKNDSIINFDNVSWYTLGTAFVTHSSKILEFYNLSISYLEKLIKEENKITWEVLIWAQIFKDHPDLFNRFQAEFNNNVLQNLFLNNNNEHNNYLLCNKNRVNSNYSEALMYYNLIKNNLEFYQKNQEKIDYEMTILHYYCFKNQKTAGAKFLINYLNQFSLYENNVWTNLKYYVETLNQNKNVKIKNLQHLELKNQNFQNTSPCKLVMKNGEEHINIRYVNYEYDENNNISLINKKSFSNENPVQTKNLYNGEIELKMNEQGFSKSSNMIEGFEDIRLFEKDNKIKFLATTKGYSKNPDQFNVITGDYDVVNHEIRLEKIFPSPDLDKCEKNWVMLNEDEMIYKWSPLRIYDYENLQLQRSYNVPKIFNYFRGSSNPIRIDNFKYCVVHTVHYENPRKYLHWIVKLNQEGYPLAYSTPFDFEGERIEYCLSMNYLTNGNLEFHYSTWDSSSKSLEIPFEYFNDKFIEV